MEAISLPWGEFDLHGFATAVTEGGQCIIQSDDVDAGPLDENEADSRAPGWAKMVLGLGFLLTGLWSGLILWSMVKVVELAF